MSPRLLLAATLSLFAAGPGFAQSPAPVMTESGLVRGAAEPGLTVYKGIPFAAPPVGDLRWRAPQPPQPWTDVLDATSFGPVSPQPRSPIPMGLGTRADEDCLFLNIWAPSGSSAGGARPVMVWLHGGAYIFGSGSQPLYDGSVLAASCDVVVVTLNYVCLFLINDKVVCQSYSEFNHCSIHLVVI